MTDEAVKTDESPVEAAVEAPVAPQDDTFYKDLGATRSQLTELGVPPNEVPKPEDKIPGLELTWEQALLLEIEKPKGVKAMQEVKKKYNLPLFVIPGRKLRYIFRGTTEREWTNFVREMKVNPERLKMEEGQGTTEDKMGQITTLMKELVIQKFCVLPPLNIDTIRDGISPGEVAGIYEAFMAAIDFSDVPPPAIPI